MKGLTAPQRKTLDVIAAYIAVRSYPPSIREIAEALGVSSHSTAYYHVKALRRKGYITVDGGPRTMRIVQSGEPS